MKEKFQNKLRSILSQVESIKKAKIYVVLSTMKCISLRDINDSSLEFSFLQEPRNPPFWDKYVLDDNSKLQATLIEGDVKVSDIIFIEREVYKMQTEEWFTGIFEYTRQEL